MQLPPRPPSRVLPLLLALALLPAGSRLAAQGPLLPTSAPGPAMRTLGQIEPRSPVESVAGDATAVYVISAPGSYYVSVGNIAGASGRAGIAIAASDVTLDLSGFALVGGAGSTRGIELRGAVANVAVRNGTIRSWGTAGVGVASGAPTGVSVEDLRISGVAGPGIDLQSAPPAAVSRCVIASCRSGILLGSEGTVTDCTIRTMADPSMTAFGILAGAVTQCDVASVSGASATGIRGTLVNACAVRSVDGSGNGNSFGIQGDSVAACRVSNVGLTNTGVNAGISAKVVANSTVNGVGNSVSSSIQYGILANGTVSDCQVETVGTSGCSAILNGIKADIAARSRVVSLFSSGSITGIAARVASACTVIQIVQLGSATASISGITADRISDSVVDLLTGSGSGATIGYLATRSVSGSTVTGLNNSGSGGEIGIDAAAGAVVESCHLNLVAVATGIRAADRAQIRHCVIAGTAIGIGIDDGGTGCVMDGNTVANCTTGIRALGTTLVVRNRVTLCTNNILPAATCQVGPIISAQGTIAAGANPWANFTD